MAVFTGLTVEGETVIGNLWWILTANPIVGTFFALVWGGTVAFIVLWLMED